MKKGCLFCIFLWFFAFQSFILAKELKVFVNDSIILKVPDLERVAIGAPEIADVVVVSGDEVLINGKKEGETSLYVWAKNERVCHKVHVIEKHVPLEKRIEPKDLTHNMLEVPGLENVSFTIVEDKVILKGIVTSTVEKNKAEDLSKTVSKEVINLIEVVNPLERIKTIKGLEHVEFSLMDKSCILKGLVNSQHDKEKAEDLAKSVYEKVVNLIDVKEPIQVLVKLQLIEISKGAKEELGIKWFGTYSEDRKDVWVESFEYAPKLPLYPEDGLFNIGLIPYSSEKAMIALLGKLKTLQKEGRSKVLSNPRLLTLSGKEAYVNVGGKTPIPVKGREGEITVEWIDYGIQLRIIPKVDDLKNIQLLINSSVSSLDWPNKVDVWPGIEEKRVTTEVSVKDGDTIVIGGLISTSLKKGKEKIPFLGSIPILGRLFSYSEMMEEERELIALITPTIVKPAVLSTEVEEGMRLKELGE
ncbi:MAG: pilus assembly protein N-terminal domain-containing protein [bacterium]|nr:pilus assembly protein N-terminal domain-containing protein [bacterium]